MIFFDNIFIFFYFACKLTECIRIVKSGFDTSDTFKKVFLNETKCNQQKNVRLALILCYSANLLKKTPSLQNRYECLRGLQTEKIIVLDVVRILNISDPIFKFSGVCK